MSELSIIISLLVSFCTLISFLITLIVTIKKKGQQEESRLNEIKVLKSHLLEINTTLAKLSEQVSNMEVRMIQLDQIVSTSDLSQLPIKITAIDESLKSAHRRIEKIEIRIN